MPEVGTHVVANRVVMPLHNRGEAFRVSGCLRLSGFEGDDSERASREKASREDCSKPWTQESE